MAFFDPIFLHTALFPNSPHSWFSGMAILPVGFLCFLVWRDDPVAMALALLPAILNP